MTEAAPTSGLVPVDFSNPAPDANHPGIRVPKRCRVLQIAGETVRVPWPYDMTRLYVHPDDEAMLRAANPK